MSLKSLSHPVKAQTPQLFNVTLALADTEYSQALPSFTKRFSLQCRTATDIKLAFSEGQSGTNYYTVKANTECDSGELFLTEARTLYMQAPVGGVVAEIICWR